RRRGDAGLRKCLAGSRESRDYIGPSSVGGGGWTGFFVWPQPRTTWCGWGSWYRRWSARAEVCSGAVGKEEMKGDRGAQARAQPHRRAEKRKKQRFSAPSKLVPFPKPARTRVFPQPVNSCPSQNTLESEFFRKLLRVHRPGSWTAASQTRTCRGGLRRRGLRPWCLCPLSL